MTRPSNACDTKPSRPSGDGPLRCPHRSCPGCPLLHLPYCAQLEAKQALVTEALARHLPAGEVPPVAPVRASPKLVGYRPGAKLSLARGPGGTRVGIYRRGTHDVVDIPRCPVHHPLVAAGVRAVRSLLAKAPHLVTPGAGRPPWLRYTAFRVSLAEEALLVTLVTGTGEREGLLRSLASRLWERLPQLGGVVWNVNPSEGNEIFGPDWRELWGTPWVRERFGDLWLRASAGAFLQVNREQAAWAYRTALAGLSPGPDEDALDLYCGVGGLALTLAPRARRVVGVEANPFAVADARENAAEGRLPNVAFLEASALDGIRVLAEQSFRPAVVTLNPARKGAEEGVVQTLRELGPRAIAYLSCNPETLARDLAGLVAGGRYRVTRLQPLDFFPHTAHVETLALLECC